jgi:hypothetical protein
MPPIRAQGPCMPRGAGGGRGGRDDAISEPDTNTDAGAGSVRLADSYTVSIADTRRTAVVNTRTKGRGVSPEPPARSVRTGLRT